jgi:hypothetical protein
MTSTRRIVAGILAAATCVTLAPMVGAQVIKKDVKVEAPTPGREDTDRPFLMNWLVLIGIFALVIGVNCIPPKRGHQD